ncbi:TetR/AcrR family transcriptional regulator [Fredinandcohnia sp. 179-A 10B2 NHS]|uniref:TetR/AcrR family transcriptional regulator n=1 Tax=Fredinandcohnia sp. 179-A 10B2 NHS TaxID=3235176 RepID=UPI0039A068F5
MVSKFLNMDQEKQDRIINAATKEFAEKGFSNASTNEIVKQAGISKGLLFHYFKNKKELYVFLYEYYLELMVKDLFGKIDLEEGDIFTKYRSIAWHKFELMKKHPEMFDFVRSGYEEKALEVKLELQNKNKDIIADSYAKLSSKIDVEKFKGGVEVHKAIQIIFWTLEGFANQKQEQTKDIPLDQLDVEELLMEMDSYIDMLRLAFYK